MPIDKQWIVNLKGKEYPVFAGVLNEAHKAGLRSLTTQIIQIPTEENGHMAIVSARAEFDDGRVFEDVGDCSPRSTSPQIAVASIRMASTRAKGRVLRDACNIGQTLLEELPDMDDAPEPARSISPAPQRQQQRPTAQNAPQRAQPPSTAPQPKPAPSARIAEQKERGKRLKAEADALGVDVTPFRPDPDTATPDDVDAMLTALERLLAEVRAQREQQEVAA